MNSPFMRSIRFRTVLSASPKCAAISFTETPASSANSGAVGPLARSNKATDAEF